VIPHLFAYIDNSRPRTAATALQTSGYNGVAAIIVKVIKLAEEVRLGRYDSSGISKLPRLTPAETLDLAAHYPNAQMAARSAVTDWDGVDDLLGGRRTEIVAYLGMQISDLHGADVADDFYEEVTNPEERDDNPVLALRKAIEQDNKKQKPMMKRQHHLAALILTFNAWHKNEALGKRWMQLVTDDMPRVDAPVSTPPEEEEAA
jgi:hypothetical protein